MRWKPLAPLTVMWYVRTTGFVLFFLSATVLGVFAFIVPLLFIGRSLAEPFVRRDVARVLAAMPLSRKQLGRRTLNTVVIPFVTLYLFFAVVLLSEEPWRAVVCLVVTLIVYALHVSTVLVPGRSTQYDRRFGRGIGLGVIVGAGLLLFWFMDQRHIPPPFPLLVLRPVFLAAATLVCAYDLIWFYRHAEILADMLRTRSALSSFASIEVRGQGFFGGPWRVSWKSEWFTVALLAGAAAVFGVFASRNHNLDLLPPIVLGVSACILGVYRNQSILSSLRCLRGLPVTPGRIVFGLLLTPVLTHVEAVLVLSCTIFVADLTLDTIITVQVLTLALSFSVIITTLQLVFVQSAVYVVPPLLFPALLCVLVRVWQPLFAAYPLALLAIPTMCFFLKNSSRVYEPAPIKEEG